MLSLVLMPVLAMLQAPVNAPFRIPAAQVGKPYSFTIPVSDPGNIKLAYTKISGELPAGISLDGGVLLGTPASPAGTYAFTIAVSSNETELARQDYSLQVDPPEVQLLDPHAATRPPGNPPETKVAAPPVAQRGEQVRLLLGFAQTGASSANSDQKLWLDSFVSRPIPLGDMAGDQEPRLRWWGDVRVDSAPRQISGPLSVSAVTAALRSLKANELAENADLLAGLDLRLGSWVNRSSDPASASQQKFAFSFILGGGAAGRLKAAASMDYPVFNIPRDSPDYPRFEAAYPQAKDPRYQYIAFVPPSRDQFSREYFAGFRLLTHYDDKTTAASPLGTVSFTVGQNELITGGLLRGVVGRIDAVYPILTGRRGLLSVIYLFGTAQLRLNSARHAQPFILSPAAAGAAPAISNTLYATTPANGDFYSIGISLDLLKLLSSINIAVKSQPDVP